ncbi:MAG: polymorphic toxin type 24 domain-containing protein [Granulosicoccus sp.]
MTLRSQNQQLEIDLSGKAHNGVPTPHTKVSPRNHKAPENRQPAYNTSEKNSSVRSATQEDIRTVRRY